jgi:hypothetical protein
MRSLYRRRFCLDCSPFGSHNTSKEPVGSGADADLIRRRRRGKSWVRYQRKRRRERKRRLVELRGGRCEDCGYDATVAALEFHHRDSLTKEFSLGNFTGSWERLLREAGKCDLVCANCHRRRHAAMWPGTAKSLSKKLRAIELMGGVCSGCRGDVPTVALEFHHLDAAEKDFGISRDGMKRPWEAILAELAKCVMLCANCHREVHAGARRVERQGGLILPTQVFPEPTAA